MLCCGDLFIWASPNAGNPQKVQRYPLEWAEALRRMLALYDAPGGGPEVLLPGHGYPIVGADRIRQALADTAELLESLVAQTLELMNAGARLDEAIHTVTPPAHLMDRPYLQPVYDEPGVRGPQRLAPLRRVVGRQPGHPEAGPRARRWPSSWPSWPAEPAPWPTGPWPWSTAGRTGGPAGRPDRADDRRPAAGRAPGRAGLAGRAGRPRRRPRPGGSVFTRRADAATSTMAQGVFAWAARESGAGRPRRVADRPARRTGPSHPAEQGFAGAEAADVLNF